VHDTFISSFCCPQVVLGFVFKENIMKHVIVLAHYFGKRDFLLVLVKIELELRFLAQKKKKRFPRI